MSTSVMFVSCWFLVVVALSPVIVDSFGTGIALPSRTRVSRVSKRTTGATDTSHRSTPRHDSQAEVADTEKLTDTATMRLEEAFGKGQGKHAGSERRTHFNKYKAQSNAKTLDPWEAQLRQSEESMDEAGVLERTDIEEIEKRRRRRREERQVMVYPDEEDIDPYDPSTFGYIEVGHVQGAHGVTGEVKVRSVTDFAVQRFCTPGTKYIKAPNRRFPRDVELIGGRFQKEDIFLVQLEGVKSRDAAAALRGHKMYVLEADEVELEENEYLVRDIIGARAYRADDESVYLGDVVGIVLGDDVSSTVGLGSDSLELRLPIDKPGDVPKVCYVPFVPAFVPVVRLGQASDGGPCVLLDLPDGLLDLAVEVAEKVVIKGFLTDGITGTRK